MLYQCLWTKLANKKVGVGAVKEINVLITPNCCRRSTHWSGGDIGILAEQDWNVTGWKNWRLKKLRPINRGKSAVWPGQIKEKKYEVFGQTNAGQNPSYRSDLKCSKIRQVYFSSTSPLWEQTLLLTKKEATKSVVKFQNQCNCHNPWSALWGLIVNANGNLAC